ncbi:MAG: inorganic phosphate transporter [Asgard group archaeon]|nr:inorganic phosphate transporter [Asgard group archaeon]
MYYVIIMLILNLLLAFSIGAQEETMSTVLGSSSLSIRKTVIIDGLLIFLGSILMSSPVGETLGITILSENVEYSRQMMVSVLFTAISWLLIGAFTKVPISLNQTVVGSIVGVLLVEDLTTPHNFLDLINVSKIIIVLIGWIVGPIGAYLISLLAEYFIQKVFHGRVTGLIKMEKQENSFRYFLIFFVALNQISTAGNQSGNALGMMYGLNEGDFISNRTLWIMIFAVAFAYLLGFVIFGRSLIIEIGESMGDIRPSETTAIEIASSLLILVTTILGIHVSSAQILVFSILGSSRMRGIKPRSGTFRRMFITWGILLPLSMVSAGLIFFIQKL